MEILLPVLWFLGFGLVCGALLALAGRIFEVKKDETVEKIKEALPGANCGGCGNSGCEALAIKIAKGEAAPNSCPVGGAKTAAVIAGILGVKAEDPDRMRAQVICCGTTGKAQIKYVYEGESDCNAAVKLGGGDKTCRYGCLGLGSCVVHCPFSAISLKDGVAYVDYEKCTGCGVCASYCPKHIIKLIPFNARVWVGCSSPEKGASLRKICEAGCIGCRLCVKACEHGAITVEDNLASIDYAKCVSCGKCAEVCPRKIIQTFSAHGEAINE
ncbi:MAG: Fe-S cluster domain-containing protein [Clostridia bacterium]|nr:Fe-S cluster domain-containing protein [Clostridia bacterium]MBQ3870340.1 Fe-S cluster domain-containing protein [Clostridia bacterium]